MRWIEADEKGLTLLEAGLPGARAIFSSRLGGVSRPPFDSLNLGISSEDEPAAVLANRDRFSAAVGLRADRIAIARQVHRAAVAGIGDGPDTRAWTDPGCELPARDGHHTADPALGLLVLVADCLPIALSGPGGVAMLHAGWRGLAAGIVENGCRAVAATHAAIGPGIGPCCYEVGPEVLAAFADLGEGIAGEGMLDLAEVARRRLAGAGVSEVESAGICTSCSPDLFFSHRRDRGRTGRQAGMVWRITGPPG